MTSDESVLPLPGGGHADPPEHLSPFQQHVVDVVAALEPGELVTYGEVALEAGHPGAGQAVANVLRRVPGLPWWRVLPASGHLYRQHRDVATPLLLAEGHTIDESGRVHPGSGTG
ncbi:MGMT family protein [Aeromicrobium fastidiosum]|uniref:MGMT family protein n=1 Tax=Aeromicrobium fastidiosum TaxID=52699 RepID=A0A641AJC7_9ACTN|nr:MGMT family protein [Aeromicrobium fastidiosum]KAA1373653.1 MGMT family protein [Aeromicrobium fastidiosum]MBP2391208.1 methylated-DNA-protein-cysteine methyltransferase-like protein [Aeromicrobium fastidiosum]